MFERECENYTADQRQAHRQQKARPILDQLGQWIQQEYTQVLPKSAIGQFMAYAIRIWKRVSAYTENGL